MLDVNPTYAKVDLNDKNGNPYSVASYILGRDIEVWVCKNYVNGVYSGCKGSYTTKKEFYV